MIDLVGKSLGRFAIVGHLGTGGMASVFKAVDTKLERNVAIKVILPSHQYSEDFFRRFELEAKSLAQLSHPNIVKVHDYGEQSGMPYLVMEYLPGGTLKEKLGKKAMPYKIAARLLAPIADALYCAHNRGIIHRDIKPSNILMTESGQPMLADFGIAKILDSEDEAERMTSTGSVGLGTPDYMAPEQGIAREIDFKADIYALGVVFFVMVTGSKPYQGTTPMGILYQHMTAPFPSPRDFVSTLPDSVEYIIFKAVAKKPEDRFPDMQEFKERLEGVSQRKKVYVSGDSLDQKRKAAMGIDPDPEALIEKDTTGQVRGVVDSVCDRKACAVAGNLELVIVRGNAVGQRFKLEKGDTYIGRSKENGIRLPDENASRRHALISRTPEGIQLTDMGSSNGTSLNGEYISCPAWLYPGDKLKIGDTHFLVEGERKQKVGNERKTEFL
jgi:serine/threonine protein kinase